MAVSHMVTRTTQKNTNNSIHIHTPQLTEGVRLLDFECDAEVQRPTRRCWYKGSTPDQLYTSKLCKNSDLDAPSEQFEPSSSEG